MASRNRMAVSERRDPNLKGARFALAEPLERRAMLSVSVSGIQQTLFAEGASGATAMDFAPDGRLFVTEQFGRVRIVKNGQLLPTPFATVDASATGERGLLGIAFDPEFNSNHFVYVYWTAKSPTTHNRISRFTADGDTAVPGSRVDLFDLPDLGATNHNGGAIHFGPDGKLYVGVGDNAVASNSQRLDTPLGKILRLNKDGSIPADNPFFASTTGDARAIWAYGLRNPFTFAFQPGSSKMHINDVGLGVYEEINEGQRGANYGWPTTEGPTTDPRFVGPIHAYKQTNAGGEGSSITGGAFYNPPAGAAQRFPDSYTGDYFFADYGGNFIRVRDAATGSITAFATGTGGPVDLKVGPDGALYALARNAKKIYRFTPTGSVGVTPPTVTDPPDNVTVSPGEPATFTVGASGGGTLTYQWQRNGQNIAGATSASYTLVSPQPADDQAAFRVVVSNLAGGVTSSPATLTVTANIAPTATISTPIAGTFYSGGDAISFAGDGIDPEDGTLPESAFDWEIIFHHEDHIHPFLTINDQRAGDFTIPTTGETSADVFYRLHLRVTDSAGRSTEVTRDITPTVATIALATNVPGLSLTLDGSPAPASFQGVAEIEREIGAPPTQTLNGVTYEFVSWSDSGAATHAIATPASDATFIATYQPRVGGGPPTDPIDLAAEVIAALPAAVVAGDGGKATVRVVNNAVERFAGPVTVTLFASADGVIDSGDSVLQTVSKNAKLKNGRGKNVLLRFDFPADGNGTYTLLARVDGQGTETVPENNVAATSAVVVQPPIVELGGVLEPVETPALVVGQKYKVTVTMTNSGNVIAAGPLKISLAASSDATWDSADAPLHAVTRKVKIKPGASKRINLSFRLLEPIGLAGAYRYVAGIDTAGQFAEPDEANNTAAAEPMTAV